VTAADAPWAAAGHEVAWGQIRVTSPSAVTRTAGPQAEPVPVSPGRLRLGPGLFDAAAGRLVELGGHPVEGPRLDVWRAPTDNDLGSDEPEAARWRAAGLHRMHTRVTAVEQTAVDGGGLVVRTRVAPPALGFGMLTDYHWSVDDGRLRLRVDLAPDGTWPSTLPRLGLRMAVPGAFGTVEWFGGGPGEAYADSRQAARVGRHTAGVDALQTPYVRPQENGNRVDARWLTLTAPDGTGLRVAGEPFFDFAVRRWTTEDLDAAAHTPDLVPGDLIHLNLDLAQHGLGSAACGPGVLPQYRLHARKATFTLTFDALGEGAS
jgi:beta-galactosidase